MNVEQRIAMETRIARKFASEMIGHGFSVSVCDGEEWTVHNSADVSKIMAAIQTTDMDVLAVFDGARNRIGAAQFIYGNDGYDVIADYSCALEPYMVKTSALIAKLES